MQQSSKYDRQYTSTITERNEQFLKNEKDNSYTFAAPSRFRPIDKDVPGGARAIRVQSIPNGAVGRPVEFESKRKAFAFYLSRINNQFLDWFYCFQLMGLKRDREILRYW